ncbi:MAG: ABC transporter ATP-binding protein [Myxococcales bacterium FL481]|nr:MAG: ABC transporter ATP-binding protein [Myxococcales bacterium FL481]
MIELCGVTKVFQGPDGRELRVLDNLDLRVESGTSISVVGPSGSGKSTLLALIAGLDRPTRGVVTVADERVSEYSEEQLAAFRARTLGFVFQSFQLIDSFTARQNVQIAAEIAGIADAPARTLAALARVGLAERHEHRPHAMSGGEQQRVAIARAIVTRPRVLLCDEPTGSLDRDNAQEVLKLLRELQHELKTTMVIVTHDLELAPQFDRMIELRHGQLATSPTTPVVATASI